MQVQESRNSELGKRKMNEFAILDVHLPYLSRKQKNEKEHDQGKGNIKKKNKKQNNLRQNHEEEEEEEEEEENVYI